MAAEQPSPDSVPLDESLLPTSRPWSEFLSLSLISLPVSLSDATSRLSRNLTHFRVNYVIISLLVLLFSLIFHPIAIIVFLATLIAWFFFYFYRSTPILLFNRTLPDRVVLLLLTLVTIFSLVFSAVWFNLLVSALISAAFICFHGVLMVTNFGDDPYGGLLYSVVEDPLDVYTQF